MEDKILYKYRPIDQYTLKLLENNEFHFSFPIEFNDPFDCDASIEYEGSQEEIIKWLKKYDTNGNSDSLINSLNEMNFDFSKMNIMLSSLYSHTKGNLFLINCFTEEKDNILMWSHYANNHKGICLGFKTLTGKNELSFEMDELVNKIQPQERAIIYKVDYQDNYPRAYNPMKDDSLEMFKFLKTKSIMWRYENEYRTFIIYNYFKKKEFRFKKEILREVIFGVWTSNEDMEKIIKIVNEVYIKKGINVKFFKTEKIKSKYKINIKML